MPFTDITILIPSHGLDDLPSSLPEKQAASFLNAFACVWHPDLLASARVVPKWRRADDPGILSASSLVLIPTASESRLPGGWLELARKTEATILTGLTQREEYLAEILKALNLPGEIDSSLVADFYALGSTYFHLESLTRKMRNYSNFDEHRMHREAVAAADAALDGDEVAARKHLKTCFEMLHESRERFYPMECFFIDFCLVTPETWEHGKEQIFKQGCCTNLLTTSQTWEEIFKADPSSQQHVKAALESKQAELLGGDDVEVFSSLLSLDSTLWHLQTGREKLQALTGVTPQIWARKRFGLSTQMPQLLNRLGYHGAIHTLLDDGLYPEDEQAQLRWIGCSGKQIDAYSRIPIPADSARGIFSFSERMMESMEYDHIGAIMFVRWPACKNPFYDDLRRAHTFAPVLGRMASFTEYFEATKYQGRNSDFLANPYLSPALVHAVAKEEPNPISRYVQYWGRERQFLQVEWLQRMSQLIQRLPVDRETLQKTERILRESEPEAPQEIVQQSLADLQANHTQGVQDLTQVLTSRGTPGEGVLILNTLSFARRVLIDWPATGSPPRDPAVLGIQTSQGRTQVLLALPPSGFVWLAVQAEAANATGTGKTPLAEEFLLRSSQFEVRLSEQTGTIAQVKTYKRTPNRISQQLALRFPSEKTVVTGEGDDSQSSKTFYTKMQLRESRVLQQGPLVGEIAAQGDLLDPVTEEVLATYRQWTRVIAGKNIIEIDLELSPAAEITGDPWTNYIACRFAWKHEMVALTASQQQGAHLVSGDRIEAPQFLEIADDEYRTTILTPGLPYHRRSGERMLDSLLITEGESARLFRFAIAIDNPFPMQAHLDQFTTVPVIKTETAPVGGKQEGWFLSVSTSNVQIQRILAGHQPESLIVRLLETEGRCRNVVLSTFLTVKSAYQVDFNGKRIMELPVEQGVQIEVMPYEICDVELTFET